MITRCAVLVKDASRNRPCAQRRDRVTGKCAGRAFQPGFRSVEGHEGLHVGVAQVAASTTDATWNSLTSR